MRVTFLGAGHIARALGEGWSSPALGRQRPWLVFFDPQAARAAELAAACDGTVGENLPAAVAGADVVVLAMRPKDVPAALDEVAPHVGTVPVVSLAAFVSLADLRSGLPGDSRVGRVMPNVAAAVGQGVALLAEGTLGEAATPVERLFGLTSTVVRLPEELFDVATAISGCGPAFAAYALSAFAAEGARRGLERDVAERLAAAAMAGAAALVLHGDAPDELVERIAVPGGMTAAGIDALAAGSVDTLLAGAVAAAAERAVEG